MAYVLTRYFPIPQTASSLTDRDRIYSESTLPDRINAILGNLLEKDSKRWAQVTSSLVLAMQQSQEHSPNGLASQYELALAYLAEHHPDLLRENKPLGMRMIDRQR